MKQGQGKKHRGMMKTVSLGLPVLKSQVVVMIPCDKRESGVVTKVRQESCTFLSSIIIIVEDSCRGGPGEGWLHTVMGVGITSVQKYTSLGISGTCP